MLTLQGFKIQLSVNSIAAIYVKCSNRIITENCAVPLFSVYTCLVVDHELFMKLLLVCVILCVYIIKIYGVP